MNEETEHDGDNNPHQIPIEKLPKNMVHPASKKESAAERLRKRMQSIKFEFADPREEDQQEEEGKGELSVLENEMDEKNNEELKKEIKRIGYLIERDVSTYCCTYFLVVLVSIFFSPLLIFLLESSAAKDQTTHETPNKVRILIYFAVLVIYILYGVGMAYLCRWRYRSVNRKIRQHNYDVLLQAMKNVKRDQPSEIQNLGPFNKHEFDDIFIRCQL